MKKLDGIENKKQGTFWSTYGALSMVKLPSILPVEGQYWVVDKTEYLIFMR